MSGLKGRIDKGYEKLRIKDGKLFGAKTDIYRPSYDSVDNDPSLVKPNIMIRVDTGAKKFVEPALSNVEVYSTFAPAVLVKVGDVLVRGPLDNPDPRFGISTILHWGEEKEMVALRTSLKCHISVSQDYEGNYVDLFQNVYYDIVGSGYTQGQIGVPDLDRSAGTAVPLVRVAMFTREGMISGDYVNLTLREIRHDGTENGRRWIIKQIDRSGSVMVLLMEQMH